jgi:hypothetical protein
MNKKVTVKLLSLPINKGISISYPYQEVFSCKFECLGKVLECNAQKRTNDYPFSVENYYDGENVFFVKSEINIDELGGHLCSAILNGVFDSYQIGDTYLVEFDEDGYII